MKWWFSSWNLFLFSLSKVCRIFSADRFISGFTASQSPLFCEAKYSGLHFAHKAFCFLPHFPQSFSLRYVLKSILKKTFSTCVRLHFFSFTLFSSPFLVLRVHKKINHLPTYIGKFQSFCGGVSPKFFTPPPHYNWKVVSRLSGYFTKILQKFFRYNWFFADGNISVFSKNLKHPPYILDICISFGGVFSEK